jgi:hypothetical protein
MPGHHAAQALPEVTEGLDFALPVNVVEGEEREAADIVIETRLLARLSNVHVATTAERFSERGASKEPLDKERVRRNGERLDATCRANGVD